jgi:glyoxylase-like metal-dependent hydrolase (beta-lactamase superfamily II)
MIDGGRAANADALIEAVKKATGATRIHSLINTHWHPEQVGANEAVGKAGGVIVAHEKTQLMLSNTVYNAIGITGRVPALPPAARPTKTVRFDGVLEFPGQQVDFGYMPAAHTDGDLYIHIPKLNLLVAGGVVSAEEWPLLDYQNGAWLGGRVRGVEHLADLVKPDTRVVPASGRMMTGKEILRHRDIYQKLYSTMIAYLNKGTRSGRRREDEPLKEYGSEFGDPRRSSTAQPLHDDRLRARLASGISVKKSSGRVRKSPAVTRPSPASAAPRVVTPWMAAAGDRSRLWGRLRQRAA